MWKGAKGMGSAVTMCKPCLMTLATGASYPDQVNNQRTQQHTFRLLTGGGGGRPGGGGGGGEEVRGVGQQVPT